jgi:uncharacterized membrane-anchored protein
MDLGIIFFGSQIVYKKETVANIGQLYHTLRYPVLQQMVLTKNGIVNVEDVTTNVKIKNQDVGGVKKKFRSSEIEVKGKCG